MTITIKEIVDENVVVTLTYEVGDMFSGTEEISFSGMAITADGENAEERAAARKAFRDDLHARVAKHLRSKMAALPKEPSSLLTNLVSNYSKTVKNIEWFANKHGADEEVTE